METYNSTQIFQLYIGLMQFIGFTMLMLIVFIGVLYCVQYMFQKDLKKRGS